MTRPATAGSVSSPPEAQVSRPPATSPSPPDMASTARMESGSPSRSTADRPERKTCSMWFGRQPIGLDVGRRRVDQGDRQVPRRAGGVGRLPREVLADVPLVLKLLRATVGVLRVHRLDEHLVG